MKKQHTQKMTVRVTAQTAYNLERLIQEANELDLTDPQEYRERRYEQKKALTECKTVLFLIELSFEKELISSEQCAEWTRHVMNVKNMTAKWRKQDRERFAALQQNRGITPRR